MKLKRYFADDETLIHDNGKNEKEGEEEEIFENHWWCQSNLALPSSIYQSKW